MHELEMAELKVLRSIIDEIKDYISDNLRYRDKHLLVIAAMCAIAQNKKEPNADITEETIEELYNIIREYDCEKLNDT